MSGMGMPRRLLADDEQVALSLRPHWKALVRPAAVLLVVSPATAYVAAALPDASYRAALRIAVLALGTLILLRTVVWPFLRWYTTLYVVTNRRLIVRSGVVARHGRDVPLSRINDVTFDHAGVLDRILGCGMLVVESGGERGQLVMRAVPDVEIVQREIYRLADEDDRRRANPTS